jgi:hypothetical protein
MYAGIHTRMGIWVGVGDGSGGWVWVGADVLVAASEGKGMTAWVGLATGGNTCPQPASSRLKKMISNTNLSARPNPVSEL